MCYLVADFALLDVVDDNFADQRAEQALDVGDFRLDGLRQVRLMFSSPAAVFQEVADLRIPNDSLTACH